VPACPTGWTQALPARSPFPAAASFALARLPLRPCASLFSAGNGRWHLEEPVGCAEPKPVMVQQLLPCDATEMEDVDLSQCALVLAQPQEIKKSPAPARRALRPGSAVPRRGPFAYFTYAIWEDASNRTRRQSMKLQLTSKRQGVRDCALTHPCDVCARCGLPQGTALVSGPCVGTVSKLAHCHGLDGLIHNRFKGNSGRN
jgi:hypothetical protein